MTTEGVIMDRTFIADAAERLFFTFLEAFAAVFGYNGLRAIGDHDWHTASTLAHSGEIAGLAAVAAAVKVLAAKRVKGTITPASVVKDTGAASGIVVLVIAVCILALFLGFAVNHFWLLLLLILLILLVL